MKDDGKRLGVVKFGKLLIETGDLDPLYILLWESKMGRAKLCRWLVAYWCYYHAGLCCKASEKKGTSYWEFLSRIAREGARWPRGTERRHFRGRLATESVRRLRERFDTAEELVDWLLEAGPRADTVMNRVKTLYGFGEWISWKVPDMIERLRVGQVEFRDSDATLMFKTSLQGAEETARRYLPGADYVEAHRWVARRVRALQAPPIYDRPPNVQETETIFCKWKSHLGGHYPVGKDTHEIRLSLLRYPKGITSQGMLKRLREGPLGG